MALMPTAALLRNDSSPPYEHTSTSFGHVHAPSNNVLTTRISFFTSDSPSDVLCRQTGRSYVLLLWLPFSCVILLRTTLPVVDRSELPFLPVYTSYTMSIGIRGHRWLRDIPCISIRTASLLAWSA